MIVLNGCSFYIEQKHKSKHKKTIFALIEQLYCLVAGRPSMFVLLLTKCLESRGFVPHTLIDISVCKSLSGQMLI